MKKIIGALFSLASFIVFSQNITSNLVICMPMNSGQANDVSGNNNNGIFTSVTASSDRFNNPASALQFNGTSSKIVVPASASINNIETLNELTITSWCKITSFGPTNCFPVANKYNPTSNWGWDYTIQPPQTWNGQILVPNAPQMGGNYGICVGNEGVTVNQWDFYAITFSRSSSSFKVYKNATLLSTVNTGTYTLETTGNDSLFVGCSPAASMDYANGYIDDLKMYSRALTQAEIMMVYNGGNCTSDVLVHENSKDNGSMIIYPNPASSQLFIAVKSNIGFSDKVNMIVYSYDGKLVFKDIVIRDDSGNYSLNIENLPRGIYYIKMSSGNFVSNLKFIKSDL
jgi:hypothetical protein